jgi:hypothetical protein
VGRQHVIQKFKFLLVVLVLLTPAASFAQSNLLQKGQNPAVPLQKIPPMISGNNAASSQGICPFLERIGPFLTSDDAEFAAQSARYQLIPTSSVYGRGWPDSYFDPLRYYFDVTILTPCN